MGRLQNKDILKVENSLFKFKRKKLKKNNKKTVNFTIYL